MPPRAATLQDVADVAQVHRSTVALALRDHPRIPLRTRNRVKAIAARLGYRPSPLVTALMRYRRCGGSARQESIAYVTTDALRAGAGAPGPGSRDLFAGMTQRASEVGLRVEHICLGPSLPSERLADRLRHRGLQAVLIGRISRGCLLELPWHELAVLALGITAPIPRLHRVAENHFEAAREVVEQCITRGYRRVGFVRSDANDCPAVVDRWLGGYLLQQQRHGWTERPLVCPGTPSNAAQFTSWYDHLRPDALVVTHAAPVLHWLRACGAEVPRDVGLVELQNDTAPSRAGVRCDLRMIGAVAIETLGALIQRNESGIPASPQEVLLSGLWHEGETLPARAGR